MRHLSEIKRQIESILPRHWFFFSKEDVDGKWIIAECDEPTFLISFEPLGIEWAEGGRQAIFDDFADEDTELRDEWAKEADSLFLKIVEILNPPALPLNLPPLPAGLPYRRFAIPRVWASLESSGL